ILNRISEEKNSIQSGRSFDREYGTDTRGTVPLWRLDVDESRAAHGVRYQSTPPAVVRQSIEALNINPQDFTFVDVGCGKGRILLVASEYPFQRVTGIELSKELQVIAEENIRKYHSKKRRCLDVSAVQADAWDWMPPEENTVFFLYNPFDNVVMQRFLDNLE